MNFFEKLFKSKTPKEESLPEKAPEETKIEAEPVAEESPEEKLSLEEKLELMAHKKEEIKDLQEERLEYYNEAKSFEEKMNSLGLSDEKKKEIREQIMAEGGEISAKIQAIREEYGFSPSPVEVYSTRFKMIDNEINRIKEDPSMKYDELKTVLEGREAFDEQKMLRTGLDGFSQNMKYLMTKFKDISEFADLNNKFEEYKKVGEDKDWSSMLPKFLEFVEEFNQEVEEKIKEGNYASPGEREKASLKVFRLQRILGEIDSELHDAKKKRGRFAEEEKLSKNPYKGTF